MKEGWKMVKLGEIASYSIGLTYKPTDVVDCNGTIVLRSSNIQDSKLDLSDIIRVKTKIKDELYVQNGDILMCSRNGSAKLVGKVATINELNEPMTFGTFMTIIRSIYNPYLFYFFHSNLFKDGMRNSENPMINQITKYMLNDVTIPLPPLEEQHRIVSILDTSFEKIDALKKNAEENLKNAKALFQQVLAQELKPKEGWVEKRIDEIATFYNGKAHEQCIDENGKYILVNSKYISSNTMVGKRTNSQLFPLYKDDIVMVMSDVPNGKALAKCLIIPTDDTHSLNQRICVFRNSKINVKLLYYLINRNPYLLSFNNGENQTNLRKNDILKMRLSYPTNEAEVEFVLNRLDEQINLINELIKNKEQTIRECDALKQSILRQAFSGEL